MTTQAKPEQSNLPDDIEQLIEQRVESLVAEHLDALVKERVAQAMKRDPAKRKVAIIASKGTLDMAYIPLILATTAAAMVADLPLRPPNVERIVHLNRSAAPVKRPGVSRVTPEEALALLDQIAMIDGRDAPVFAQGHLRGAINIPIGYGQFGVMAAWLFPPETALLLIPADDEDLGDAIDSLMVAGMTNPLSALSGDQVEWKGAGLTIVETPLVNVEDLAHRITAGKVGTLVDVREKGEMEQGTIAGAINLPYREMRTCETVPSLVEPVAVFCNSGNRSSVAASLLERLGLSVMNVAGGTTAWMEAGLTLAQPDA